MTQMPEFRQGSACAGPGCPNYQGKPPLEIFATLRGISPMGDNYHKLSGLFFYLDYFNPQINYLGFAQIISGFLTPRSKLSRICSNYLPYVRVSPVFADIYWSLQPPAGQNYTNK